MGLETGPTREFPEVKPATVLSPSKMAHIALRTRDIHTMVAFYKVFLGATVVFENEELGFLRYDDEHHRIAIVQVPGTIPKDPTSCGLFHTAFTFDTLDDLLLAYSQRKAHGILPKWCINHGPTTSMYYFDPDGNQIETQIDNFDTAEAADQYMQGPSYAENPIGVEFDPEELIERLRKGADPEVIKKRVDVGPKGGRDIPSAVLPT